MVHQHPFAVAVGAAGQPDLEGVVSADAESAAASVSQQVLHLGGPLRMGGAAEAVAVGEEAGPVVAGAGVAALAIAFAPEVGGALGAVPVVRVAPEEGGEGLLLVGLRLDADDALVELGLRGEEPLERRAGEFAGVPRVVGFGLGIADVGARGAGDEDETGGQERETLHRNPRL